MKEMYRVRQSRFEGISDFLRFQSSIEADNDWVKIPVGSPYANIGLQEDWYKHKLSGEIWRLVEPDPPFRGIWERVS